MPSFPPGYVPWKTPYNYTIPGSTTELRCGSFLDEPKQNTTEVSAVILKIKRQYGNPQQANREVYNGRDLTYDFITGDPSKTDAAAIHVSLLHVEIGLKHALTYGRLIHAVEGVDYIRTTYPGLDFLCSIYGRSLVQNFDHGVIALLTGEDMPHGAVASA